ncbi:MAG: Omp28 family outer membrane lipoprotein [Flavobacteriales bacterium]|nr:Omp28 family outer membrane lipoprotein [Flavobacteriales bacterium]
MKKIKYIWCLALSTLIFSCDKVDNPIERSNVDTTNTVNIVFDTIISGGTAAKRNILLEEFTGHTCANCPQGAKEAKRLDSSYAGQVIVLAIHAGTFAEPESNPDGSFVTDFRTATGDAYNTTFAVTSYPTAMVSRLGSPDLLTKGNWEPEIQTIENDPSSIDMRIQNLYNDSLQILKTHIDLEFLASLPGSYKLGVLLTESHIVDWQLDDVIKLNSYEHNHVLRDAINGTWGEGVVSSAIGDTVSFDYQYTIPAQWVGINCELIAFVYDQNTFEIVQCERLKVH